jgi:hypothetical protein
MARRSRGSEVRRWLRGRWGGPPSGFQKPMRTPLRNSRKISPESRTTATSETSKANWLHPWTFLPVDSPVKTLASLEKGQALLEHEADSGLNSRASSRKPSRAGCSRKTSAPCVPVALTEFSKTSMRSGMMRNGIVYPLPSLVHHSEGIGSSLLPTPAAREYKDWARCRILASLDRGDGVAKRICALSPQLRLSEEIAGLNPSFAEWMMGYAIGWTDSGPSATL